MLYQISQGSKNFGSQTIFRQLQFEIRGNEKIAVVGPNGSGKTTLLKIISGEIDLDDGVIHKSNQVRLGVLNQTSFADEEISVEAAFQQEFAYIHDMQAQLERMHVALQGEHDEKLLFQYDSLLHTFEMAGGYTFESEMKTVLTKMGFETADLLRPIKTFSGGQKTRLAFAKLLLSKPDILLLDEPTNHLDISTIEWLEGYLIYYPKAIVFVSHDRYFLDKVANTVVDIDQYKTTRYTGNYSSYLHQKTTQLEKQLSAYNRQQKDIERLEMLIEKFRYKRSKAAFAQSKIKYLERMEKIEKPKGEGRSFTANFIAKIRGAKDVLIMDHCVIGYDRPLAEISMHILRGDKVAVMGDNGTGKSTLLKTIVGDLPLLSGELMLGHQIDVGYFDQDHAQFSSQKTVLEEIWDDFPELDKTQIRTVLGRFLFSGDDVFKSVAVCSGGERVRLLLAKLMLRQANLLILDEPTNHLDIPGKEALEAALAGYEGTILFVSHDRYFIEKIATSRLVFEQGKATYYPLNIEQKKSVEPVSVKDEKKAERLSLIRQKKDLVKELSKIEKQITEAEISLESLREKRFEPEYYHDYQKMKDLDDQIDDAHNVIAHLISRWEELQEHVEGKTT